MLIIIPDRMVQQYHAKIMTIASTTIFLTFPWYKNTYAYVSPHIKLVFLVVRILRIENT